ncbi:MAG: hypothetical protein AAF479_18375 [Pseudomonadota bacterium]
MSYSQQLSELRRMIILRHLADDANTTRSSNVVILQATANGLNVRSPRAQVLADLNFLADLALVTTEAKGDFVLVEATDAGVDVGKGLASIDGIANPRSIS